MSWLIMKLLAGGGKLVRLLLCDLRNLAIVLLVGVALYLWLDRAAIAEDRDDWREQAEASAAQSSRWQQGYAELLAIARRQRALAAELDQQNAARVEREQARVIEETSHDYQVRLGDSRAALERVREQLAHATASGSDSGAAAVPDDLTARCRALGSSDCDALLAALPGQLSEAEINTAKLVALQAYVRGLLGIDMNGPMQASAEEVRP